MKNNWKETFDKQFGDKFNNVEGNSKIVATGIGLTYIFSFIESLLAEQKKELLDLVEKEIDKLSVLSEEELSTIINNLKV